jgi:hypothetical protein
MPLFSILRVSIGLGGGPEPGPLFDCSAHRRKS